MGEFVVSKHGASIRLTGERWSHIVDEHGELSGLKQAVLKTVEDPERIVAGQYGERLAVRTIEPGKLLIVVYRELRRDGFVITAFMTRRTRSLDRREVLWISRPS